MQSLFPNYARQAIAILVVGLHLVDANPPRIHKRRALTIEPSL